jgi:hypothetical protein
MKFRPPNLLGCASLMKQINALAEAKGNTFQVKSWLTDIPSRTVAIPLDGGDAVVHFS